ncbi:MAG: hypothetical protein HY073_03125 [Deltaproteobacteria bacterium]|nr:hypothetical protein [Deltaproteobacteria bacterium]
MKKAKKDLFREEWFKEFKAASRRSLAVHVNNSFIHTYKPVLDDKPYRSFHSMSQYRRWCEKHLPKWLGYGRTL